MDQAELTLHLSPNVCGRGKSASRFTDAKEQVAMYHKFPVEEDTPMKDVHMSLGRENGATGNPSPPSRDPMSVTPSASSDDRYSDSPGQLVYALGRIDYDFDSRSRRDAFEAILENYKKTKKTRTEPKEHKDILTLCASD